MNSFPYFIPDPSVPDADLLGIGELMFEDGTSQYIDDPELASGMQMQSPQQMGLPDMQAVTPTPQAIEMIGQPLPPLEGADGQMYELQQDGTFIPAGTGSGPAGEIVDPTTGQIIPELDPALTTGDPFAEGIRGIGQALEVDPLANYQAPAQSPQPQEPDLARGVQAITPTPQAIQSIGQPMPPLQGADGRQWSIQQDGTFVPYERSGALPPDVAQRQLGDMAAAQQQTLQATQQARADEARLMNEYTLKAMAQNEAMRISQQQEILEQQQKVQRWREEQQALVDMNIETDLASARGPIGAALTVAGAVLMNAAGNPEGFRMIEKTIDQHVKIQVDRRDTKLGLLADQIGSAQQAIHMGKAQLYKTLADRMDLLAQKTKNDVFEAQSPAVIQQLRQKQLSELQAAEKESLGKLTERMPTPPKPPSAESLQKYGELRRDRDASTGMVGRAEQQLGLMWVPGQGGQPGHYANAQEVLKRGIEGVGELEQWMPDFVYSTLGRQEGIQVRGASQALAYAQIRQMQPTGPISNADIQAAVKAGALETEEGLIRGLERMRVNEEKQALNDRSQFGDAVVTEYDRQYRASGGRSQATAPAASRAPTLDELRGGAQALRGGPPQEQPAVQLDPNQRMQQVAEDVMTLTADTLPPEGMDILIAQAAHESGDGKSQGAAHNNFFGHKRTGDRPGFEANTTEGYGKTRQRVRDTFASYESPAAAVADHISLLQRRYPMAWEALQNGDAEGYVMGLQRGKDGWPAYFTGNPDSYLQSILGRL